MVSDAFRRSLICAWREPRISDTSASIPLQVSSLYAHLLVALVVSRLCSSCGFGWSAVELFWLVGMDNAPCQNFNSDVHLRQPEKMESSITNNWAKGTVANLPHLYV
jgi:hypothetical protein